MLVQISPKSNLSIRNAYLKKVFLLDALIYASISYLNIIAEH